MFIILIALDKNMYITYNLVLLRHKFWTNMMFPMYKYIFSQ